MCAKFTVDNSVSITFDPFGFNIMDFKTCNFIQGCDSDGELYPIVLYPVQSLLVTTYVDPLGIDVLDIQTPLFYGFCNLVVLLLFQLINFKFSMLVSLGSTVGYLFSSTTKTSRLLELIHSDLWTSPGTSMSRFKYYVLFIE